MSNKSPEVLIITGSTTGNTKKLGDYIHQSILKSGLQCRHIDVTEAKIEDLHNSKFVLLGASTWGAAQLQDDFYDFDEKMSGCDLSHLHAAAFGTGEQSWPLPCEAVNILEERLKKCNAHLLIDGLKIDDDVAAEKNRAVNWAEELCRIIKSM